MRVATFSLVAQDPKTGDLGVAVASKFLAVGAVVPFAEAGVGAIATQSYANPRYGPQGLALLRQGRARKGSSRPSAAPTPGWRSASSAWWRPRGEPHLHRGGVPPLGRGVAGKGFAAQGNLLSGSEVVEAMVETFLTAQAPFPERLLLALKAGRRREGTGGGSSPPPSWWWGRERGTGGFGTGTWTSAWTTTPSP